MSTEPRVETVEIETRWDPHNTGLLTQKLYRHVERDDFDFELEAESGSIAATFTIGVASGLAAAVLYDLGKYVVKRQKKGDLPRVVLNVTVEGDVEEFVLTEESDVELVQAYVERASIGGSDDEDDDDFDFEDIVADEGEEDEDGESGAAAAGEF